MNNETQKFVEKHGEEYRTVITHSLDWLAEKELTWKLNSPIDKDEFIEDLIRKVFKKIDPNKHIEAFETLSKGICPICDKTDKCKC